jgi:predicted Zn-dependent protease
MKRLLSASLSISLVLATAPVSVFAADNTEKDPDQIGNRNVSGKVNFYSIEKEIGLGKQLASEVERQAKIINDPVVAEYVNRVGQNLVRNSDAKVPFTIKVIDSEEVNAFALPGGFFFVNSGLILKADNARRDRSIGHDSTGVHGWLDRLWALPGGQCAGTGGVPEVFARV